MRIRNPKTVVHFLNCQKEDRAGFLWKRKSENKGSFKRRYFVACGNILAYYEKKTDREPLGVLFLEGHVIEMVDDLTMAVKFLTVKELPKGYYLRADTIDDAEQWMRVLSRSGTDFFTLTLEDLEDQLTALAAVRKSSSSTIGLLDSSMRLDSVVSSSTASAQPRQQLLGQQQQPRRSNPFNSASSAQPVALLSDMPLARSPQISARRDRQCSADRNRTRSVSPLRRHLEWLFSQTWEQLHERVRAQLCDAASTRVPPSTDEKNLIEFG